MPTPTKNSKKFRARIRKNAKDFHLGTFATYDEAREAERKARRKYPSRKGLNLQTQPRDSRGKVVA